MNTTTKTTDRLWINEDEIVKCGRHGGHLLRLSIQEGPNARRHDTALDHWNVITQADVADAAASYGWWAVQCACETCGATIAH